MAKVVPFDAWSKRRLGRRAACSAMGKATANAMIWEKRISSMSIGNDSEMMLVVDWCVVKDWPRLPWRTWPIQMKYCCQSGLLRPSSLLMVATFCDVALGPRMVVAGSPGRRWTRKNAAIETKMMMTMSSATRLAMYRPT